MKDEQHNPMKVCHSCGNKTDIPRNGNESVWILCNDCKDRLKTKKISIRVPINLLKKIDAHLGPYGYSNRSDFMKHAARQQLNEDEKDRTPNDEDGETDSGTATTEAQMIRRNSLLHALESVREQILMPLEEGTS